MVVAVSITKPAAPRFVKSEAWAFLLLAVRDFPAQRNTRAAPAVELRWRMRQEKLGRPLDESAGLGLKDLAPQSIDPIVILSEE